MVNRYQISYKDFVIEAFKITTFCLLVTAVFKLDGASNKNLLIVFNMAVMSSAATFSVEKKQLNHVGFGAFVIMLSIVIGGIIGYYSPSIGIILTIVYAGLAFYLPKTKAMTNIFVTGSVMFLIFNALPFNWEEGLQYAFDGIGVIILFVGYYWLFEVKRSAVNTKIVRAQPSQGNTITAVIAVLSLLFAWILSYYFHNYTSLSHLYWIGLTALVVIQSSQQKTIQTSIKRICINACGAIIIVILFGYLIPNDFWLNFSVLVLFLFLIFSLSFSYIGKTLLIELFVLGFTHLVGDYQNVIAFDRFFLTLIGGIIVIVTTVISYFFFEKLKLN